MRFLFIIVIFLLYSCRCDRHELSKRELTKEEEQYHPYQQGDTFVMYHGAGSRVKFIVAERISELVKSRTCIECCEDFITLQTDETTILADYPPIAIRFVLFTTLATAKLDSTIFGLRLQIGKNIGFELLDPFNTKSLDTSYCTFLDSSLVRGKRYYNVLKFRNNQAAADQTREIQLNKDFGILRFELGNAEYYELQ